MQRYLLNIGYIGTRFSGVTKNVNIKNHVSVEDTLVEALKTLKPINAVEVHPSSRTDAGVHALNTTVHVDLERYSDIPWPPGIITKRVNKKLQEWNVQLRILKTTSVNEDFHSRYNVLSRTYLYRLAVAKSKHPPEISPKAAYATMFVPIEENHRCHFILNQNFDVELARKAAKLMEGIHDFRSFMKTSREQKTLHPRFCTRKIDSIRVVPGRTIATSFNIERTNAEYNFWDFEFKSRAYFYRQIRNMVGTLIAAGEGRITERDIYEMLTIPSKHSWNHAIVPTPSYGLYLVNVEYPDNAFPRNSNNDCDSNELDE